MVPQRRKVETLVRRFGALLVAPLVVACADQKVDFVPVDAGELCTLDPCDVSCPETRCTDACDSCADFCVPDLNADQLRGCGICDPFCSPCDSTCTSCEAPCLLTREGPDLEPLRCDATPRPSDPGALYQWAIPIDVPADAPSWTIAATSDEENAIFGVSLEDADGAVIIALDDYVDSVRLQQRLNPYVLPILMPMSDAFAHIVQPGAQQLIVETEDAASPCWRVAYQMPPLDEEPVVLRLRMIAVGASLGTAEELRANPAIAAIVEEARRHFREAGIDVYVDSWEAFEMGEERDALSRIQSFGELRRLFLAMTPPGNPRATSELAVSVALVDGFGGDYLVSGITGGIPGPVLLHGSSGSGVAVSVNQLSKPTGTRTIGAVLAHELGHYLGLLHTTGIRGVDLDPLEDTPICPLSTLLTRPTECPDAPNAMFPLVFSREVMTWTPEQIRVLHANPSVNQRRDSAP